MKKAPSGFGGAWAKVKACDASAHSALHRPTEVGQGHLAYRFDAPLHGAPASISWCAGKHCAPSYLRVICACGRARSAKLRSDTRAWRALESWRMTYVVVEGCIKCKYMD